MAVVDLFDGEDDDVWRKQKNNDVTPGPDPNTPYPDPAPPPPPQQSASTPPPAPSPAPFDAKSIVEGIARNAGISVESSDIANLAGKHAEDRDQFIRDLQAQAQRRAAPTDGRPFDSQGPMYNQATNSLNPAGQAALAQRQNPSFRTIPQGASRDQWQFMTPGDQFGRDPYSQLLEQIARQQLEALQQPQSNPQMDRLLSFLDQRFTDLSQHPGYSPDELALLHTQAFEPVEANRQASQKRARERTASRGMLPSSGLLEDEARQIDTDYDRTRAALDRDLGVNAIGKRQQDLAQAQMIGQLMGIQIPQLQRAEDQQRRTEVLNLGNLLYQMPRQAMFDANTIVNGSPAPPDLFNQAVQMLNAQQQNQQMNDQRNAAFWAQLGQLFGDLFQ